MRKSQKTMEKMHDNNGESAFRSVEGASNIADGTDSTSVSFSQMRRSISEKMLEAVTQDMKGERKFSPSDARAYAHVCLNSLEIMFGSACGALGKIAPSWPDYDDDESDDEDDDVAREPNAIRNHLRGFLERLATDASALDATMDFVLRCADFANKGEWSQLLEQIPRHLGLTTRAVNRHG